VIEVTAAARRITRTLFVAQGLGLAAVVAMFPIATIVGAKLAGRPTWAGIPVMLYQLGQAFAAPVWGQVMDRFGRRAALISGLSLGVVGAAMAGSGVIVSSFVILLIGMVVIGGARSTVELSRFVAAEVHRPEERGRAISTVVLGGTVGAIVGPLLAGPMGTAALRAGLDELVGPYGVTLLLYGLAALVLVRWLRPEPRDLAALVAADCANPGTSAGPARSIREIMSRRPAQVAVLAMVFAQAVMTMLMVITPLHMRQHQHSLSQISYVISAHVVGMYAFSVLSGRLADRWGRGPVIAGGAGVLLLAALAARLSPKVLPLGLALFLVGFGWNFCYVGGSSLLADQLTLAERGRTQGFNDLLVGLSAAAGSFGSGIVFAAVGFGTMGIAAAAVALILLALTLGTRVGRRAPAPVVR